jgi:DNA-binding MarR family transcriptional regulator
MAALAHRSESMGYQVNHLARLLAQLLSRHVGHYGVAPGQFPVLLALYDEDGQTPAELCAAVAVEPGTMTKTLQRMERDALVERRPDPHDGRRVRINLTGRARQLEPKLKAIAVDLNATVLEGVSLHQRGCFMGALRRVIRNTEAQLQAQRPAESSGLSPWGVR